MPHGRDKPKTYTQSAIKQWQKDIGDIPKAIETCNENIRATKEQIVSLKIKTLPLIESLNTVNTEIDALTAQINVLTLPKKLTDLETQKNRAETNRTKLNHEHDQVMSVIQPLEKDIRELEASIETIQLREASQQLTNELMQKEASLKARQIELSALQTQKRSLDSSISSLESTLSSLRWQQSFDNIGHIADMGHHHHHYDSGYGSTMTPHGGYHSHLGHTIGTGLHVASDISRDMNIWEIESQLSSLRGERSSVTSKISTATLHTSSLQHTVTNLQRDKRQKDSRITQLSANATRIGYGTPYQLQQELTQKQNSLAPQNQERQRLEKAISAETRTISNLTREIDSTQSTLTHSRANNEKYKNKNNVAELEKMRAREHGNKDYLLSQKRPIDGNILSNESTLYSHQQELKRLKEKQSRHNNNIYLQNLTYQPQALYMQLKQDILDKLAKYEDEHPAEQTHKVRSALLTIHEKLAYIDRQGLDVGYELLCGLVWHLHSENERNAHFSQTLKNIMGDDFLDKNESLSLYQAHSLSSPQLRDLTPVEVFERDKSNYETAQRKLNQLSQKQKDAPKPMRDLQNSAKNVLNTVNGACKKPIKKNNLDFDLHLHTTILRNTAKLSQNPADHTALNKHHQLAGLNTKGKPSLCKKIVGALMMFSGAALAAVSVGFGVATLGMGSPLAIAGTAGGAALAATGAGLFFHGRHKGISKALQNTEKKVTAAAPFSLWKEAREPHPPSVAPPAYATHYFNDSKETLPVPSAPPLGASR